MKHAAELRLGLVTDLYYAARGMESPNYLDILYQWFGELLIAEEPSDGEYRRDARYIDLEYRIHAVRVHERLYIGQDKRVTQIAGRLIGTAKGNREKERKAAELIQKHVAGLVVNNPDNVLYLQENARKQLDLLSEDALQSLYEQLGGYTEALVQQRAAMSREEAAGEPFPMDDEVFDQVLYNAVYQLNLASCEGLVNAWLWLLCGSLLRNECGRVTRVLDSSWINVYREPSEDGTLQDRLNYLTHPEEYIYTYSGDDLEKRYPGIEWYCDACRAHLNDQPGFDDRLPVWKCTACGHENRIDITEIYDSRQDYEHERPSDPAKIEEALQKRKNDEK